MRHVLLFAVLFLSTFAFAADKLPEKKAAKPSDQTAQKKTHTLPADATATVILFDYRGGMLKAENDDPLMVIRADGSVLLGDRYRKNARIETRITKEDLQALLQLAIDTNEFFTIDAAEIERSIDAELKRQEEELNRGGVRMHQMVKKADGSIVCEEGDVIHVGVGLGKSEVLDEATTVVRIHADAKDHEVRYYALDFFHEQSPKEERLTRLRNIAKRLTELERKLRAEAAAGDQKDIEAVKKFLAATYPGERWNKGPTRQRNDAIDAAYPDSRFYYVTNIGREGAWAKMIRVDKDGVASELGKRIDRGGTANDLWRCP